MIKLLRLKNGDKNSWEDVNRLIPQLSSSARKLSFRDFRKITRDINVLFFVFRDGGKIIGMGFLVFLLTPVGLRARIEDMVIDENYRGKGLGIVLTRRLIAEAKKRQARWVEFTSRKDRVATNRFYQKFGFKPRDINVYRLPF